MKITLLEYCTTHFMHHLLSEWHPQKNEDLSPDQISYGSNKKVWWRCEKGHEWQSPVYYRTIDFQSCPHCSKGRCSSDKSLAVRFPELAEQWHPSKNGDLLPEHVSVGSKKLVWWRCEKGHEWSARIDSRTIDCGCPICSNKKIIPGVNDFASMCPDLAAQWHPEKNNALKPEQFAPHSCKKVWWRCEKGHEWEARIAARKYNDCPVCTNMIILTGENDLATIFPEISEQWSYDQNEHLRPEAVSPHSSIKVWWKCKKGHEWQATIASRTSQNTGCPYCAGRYVLKGFNDLQTREPLIAAQWHNVLNGELKPDMVTVGSRRRVYWECADGHVWQARIDSRTSARKHSCPICSGRYKAKTSPKR